MTLPLRVENNRFHCHQKPLKEAQDFENDASARSNAASMKGTVHDPGVKLTVVFTTQEGLFSYDF